AVAQQLERDELAGRILRLVDDPHAAAPQLFGDLVAGQRRQVRGRDPGRALPFAGGGKIAHGGILAAALLKQQRFAVPAGALAGPHGLAEVLAAEGDIAVVAADLDLGAGAFYFAFRRDTDDHGRLAAAAADGLQLRKRVGPGQEGGAAG